MKGKLQKKLTAVSISAMLLFGLPANTYAVEFGSAEVFSSAEEADGSLTQEETFSSGTDASAEDSSASDISTEDASTVEALETDVLESILPLTDVYLPYISTISLPVGKEGVYYTAQLEGISNNGRSLRWSVKDPETLPQGISITADGLLFGTPRENGRFEMQVTADNTEAVSTQRLELYIDQADPVLLPYAMQLERDTIDLGIFPSGGQGSSFIVVQNTGQNLLHIKSLPQCDYFDFEWYYDKEDGTIQPGSSCYIRVKSREGLANGYYEEKINIETVEGISGQAVVKINIGAASQKDYDLKISPSPLVIDEWTFDDPETRVEAFVSITNIGKKDTKITRDTSMLVNYRVDDHSINLDDEEAEDVHRILKPGESIQLCVVPLNRYGNFREEFYVYTDDGSKFAVPITQEMDDPDYLSKLVKMTPGKIKYDAAYAYYEQAPEARPITIENNSDMAVNLSQKGELGLKVGKLDKSRLEPGEKAEFTVQPAPGLSSGEYSWWVNVRAETDNGKTAYLYTTVRFMVFADNFEGVGEIPDVTGLANGTEKTAEALRLPHYVSVRGDGDETFVAEAVWNVDDCSYNPEVKEEQIFMVKGQLNIPPEQNNKHLDTTVEIRVQVKAYDPLAQPVIDSAYERGNYIDVELYDKINDATGYQYVLVYSEADLEKGNFAISQNSTSTSVSIKYIPKGKYSLYCRPYKKEEGKTTYGKWSEGVPVTINVVTGKAPKISKATVSGCDVRITISAPDKISGFDAVLAKKKSGKTPVDYAVTKINQAAGKKTITLNGAAKGTYYVAVHSYTRQDGRKILSPWSNLIKVTVKDGKINTAPVIKKVSISGRKVSVTISRAKGTQGSDWVLAKSTVNHVDGSYLGVYDYAYIQKNKTGTKITFQNVKPGTYYLSGHAYKKGYTKSFTNWSEIRKIVIK